MMARLCAVGIIRNKKGEILVAKMPPKRGAYPGDWGILGGGIDENEELDETLKREAKEEFGIEIANLVPYTFHDDTRNKYFADGHVEEIYMVYNIYDCEYIKGEVTLNDEWEEYRWVETKDLKNLKLNEPTKKTFKMKGWL